MADRLDVRYVREVILKDLARRYDPGVRWTVEDRVITGRDGWIFKAHNSHAPFPLALKVYCTAVAPEEAARQTELLRHYHDAMASRQGLTVPTPVAALPEHRTLVMEWIDEPRMDRLLRQTRRSEERARLLAAAGSWLRHFHEQSGFAVQPIETHQVPRSIDVMLGGEDGAGMKVRDRVFRSAYCALVRGADEFAGTPLPHVTAYDDFAPKNLLHGRGRTVGIDIRGRSILPVTSDIFHFLVQAEMKTPRLTRASHGITGHDAQALLNAYGATGHLRDERLMAFFYLAAATMQWARRIYRVRRRGFSSHRMVHLLLARHAAQQAVSALQAPERVSNAD